MDDKENLSLLAQQKDQDDGVVMYDIVSEKSLSEYKGFSKEIARFKKKPFNRLAVTDRVIRINDQNFNFCNGHMWDLRVFRGFDESKKEKDIESDEDYEDGEGQNIKQEKRSYISYY